MKATGIIRRVDDFGRVVIPKEIRRTCKIREGDPLEIYIDKFNEMPVVCFAKYEKESARDTIRNLYREACDDGDLEIAQILRDAEQELTELMNKRSED